MAFLGGVAGMTAQDRPAPADSPQDTEGPAKAVGWKSLPGRTLGDQKLIWLFPVRLARGHNWVPVLGVVGITAGLVALDQSTAPYFRRTPAFHDFNNMVSGQKTAAATAIVPLSLYVLGLARKDSYAKSTAMLAGEAVLDVEVLTTVMKDLDRRLRPGAISANGDFSDTWFRDPGGGLRGAGSFPSGHTIAAFSIATVVARRYGRRRWVPWVAYGAAALVSFSRISLSAHFPSDVFMGAALGYSISRYVVLRQ